MADFHILVCVADFQPHRGLNLEFYSVDNDINRNFIGEDSIGGWGPCFSPDFLRMCWRQDINAARCIQVDRAIRCCGHHSCGPVQDHTLARVVCAPIKRIGFSRIDATHEIDLLTRS